MNNKKKFPPDITNYSIKLKKEYQNNFNFINLIDNAIKSYSSRMIIIKDNEKIVDVCNKNDLKKKIQSYSVTKSFLAFAIMFLLEDKKLKSLETKISDYIQSWRYGKKKDITFYDILTHTSGLDNYWDFDKFTGYDKKTNDFKYKVNAKTLSNQICKIKETGKQWEYNNTATQVLCTIVEEISGMNIKKYLDKKLFIPLGIRNYEWVEDKFGNPYGPFGLCLDVNDYFKIGNMILNKGTFNKKKIIDNRFLNKMFKKEVDNKMLKKDKTFKINEHVNYGLCWWIYKDFKYANGYLGQYFVINRKKNIIALRLIDSKWNNKNFNKESKNKYIYYKNFMELLDKI